MRNAITFAGNCFYQDRKTVYTVEIWSNILYTRRKGLLFFSRMKTTKPTENVDIFSPVLLYVTLHYHIHYYHITTAGPYILRTIDAVKFDSRIAIDLVG